MTALRILGCFLLASPYLLAASSTWAHEGEDTPPAAAKTAAAKPPTIPTPKKYFKANAENMKLVGYSDLQGRSAYQPSIIQQGDRWIAYVGHHGQVEENPKPINPITNANEFNGTSIVDVTDPKNPKYLAHIPGEEGLAEQGGGQMVRVCSGKTLPHADKSKTYMLRTFGNAAHEIFDVTIPEKPQLLQRLGAGTIRGTHKNFWECDSGIALLVSGLDGWKTRRMTQVYDLSDPANPKLIRNFGLPGQQPGATGEVPQPLHGPISLGPQGNRIYFGYGTNRGGVLQIVDRDKLLNGPKEPTVENLLYPQVGRMDMTPVVGAHTALPLGKMAIPEFAHDRDGQMRDMIMLVDEGMTDECAGARQMVWFVDATVEAKPMVVSNWTVPESEDNYCTRGARFGAHSSNEHIIPAFDKKLVFITFFSAGLRVLDIRDPFQPKEVGHYIPAVNARTFVHCPEDNGIQPCQQVVQSNNAEVDDRGYIYLADRAGSGLHILEVSGAARKIAGLK